MGKLALAFACLTACWPEPAHPPRGPHPTLRSDAQAYNSRVVALRTTLGRAGIELVTRGPERELRTASCRDPSTSHCDVCELADRTREIDDAAIEAITAAFAEYPASMLDAAHVEKVALCRRINTDGKTAGSADPEDRILMISLEPFVGPSYNPFGLVSADEIVHHELFHLLEGARMSQRVAGDPEWDAFGERGFVDDYARTSEIEDRASIYQYLLARTDELCDLARTDEVVRAKAAVIWHRVAGAVSGADAFLRQHAKCVDWIDEPR